MYFVCFSKTVLVAALFSCLTFAVTLLTILAFQSGVYGYSGVGEAVRTIYSKEGARGLTCGLLPTLLRDAPFSGLYLLFYTQIKLRIPNG